MTPDQIKAICRDLYKRFGADLVLKHAGVCKSVWSDYVNYSKPDTTIPMGRALSLEDGLGVRDFTDAFADRARQQAEGPADPRRQAVQTLAVLSDSMSQLDEALADEHLTDREKQRLLEQFAALSSRVAETTSTIASMPTGRVKLRAV